MLRDLTIANFIGSVLAVDGLLTDGREPSHSTPHGGPGPANAAAGSRGPTDAAAVGAAAAYAAHVQVGGVA